MTFLIGRVRAGAFFVVVQGSACCDWCVYVCMCVWCAVYVCMCVCVWCAVYGVHVWCAVYAVRACVCVCDV